MAACKRNLVEIGLKVGSLTVLSFTEKTSGSNTYIDTHCKCECGTEINVRKHLLVTNKVRSCGCSRTKYGDAINEMIGKKYGKLTVIGVEKDVNNKGRKLALTKCDCGNERILRNRVTHLKNGKVRSCGCSGAEVDYNYSFFETHSPERSYILGLLATDGCLHKNGDTFSLTLQKKDKSILEKISILLCNTIRLTEIYPAKSTQSCFLLRIGSKKIYNDLLKLGLYNNKTSSYTVPDQFKYDVDFWRGVIDGDGHISTSLKNNFNFVIGICGTNSVCQGFKDFINHLGYLTNNKVRVNKSVTSFDFRCFTFSGKKALSFCKTFYENKSDFFMERKYNKFLEGLENYKNSSKYDPLYLH